jgi:hypothetical protein
MNLNDLKQQGEEQNIKLQRLLLSPEGALLRTEEMEGINIKEKLEAARKTREVVPAGHEARVKVFVAEAERIAEAELAAEEEKEKEKEVFHEQAT